MKGYSKFGNVGTDIPQWEQDFLTQIKRGLTPPTHPIADKILIYNKATGLTDWVSVGTAISLSSSGVVVAMPSVSSGGSLPTGNIGEVLMGGGAFISQWVNAKEYGAVGDGVTDDTAALQAALDDCFGSVASPHGTAGVLDNKQLYIPPGEYRITSPLQVKYMHGGRVFGAGRFVTKIVQATAGEKCFITNGCGYSYFGSMYMENDGTAILFDLSWDGTAGGPALQSVTFQDMFFQGGTYGVLIAGGGFQGDTVIFLNCFWHEATVAGLAMSAFNAIGIQVYGGDFQACAVGIKTLAGACNIVSGPSFQQSAECDIRIDGSTNNAMFISGVRTESTNFVHNYGGMNLEIRACSQLSALNTVGNFYYSNGGQAVISTCISTYGVIKPLSWSQLRIENSSFAQVDWLKLLPGELWSVALGNSTNWRLDISDVAYGYAVSSVEIQRERWLTDDQGATIQVYQYLGTLSETDTPTALPLNVSGHFDASDTDHIWTTLTGVAPYHSGVPVDGSAVQVWDDEDGLDLAAIYHTTTAQSPLWRTGGSSPMAQPCLHFDGTRLLLCQEDDGGSLTLSDFFEATEFAILVAFRVTSVTTDFAPDQSFQNEMIITDADSFWGLSLRNDSGTYTVTFGVFDTAQRNVILPISLAHDYVLYSQLVDGQMYAALYDSTGLLDSGTNSCGRIGNRGFPLVIGAGFYTINPGHGHSNSFDGYLGEVLLFSTVPATADKNFYINTFRAKWVP